MIGYVTWWAIYLGMISLWTGVDNSPSRKVNMSDPQQAFASAVKAEEANEQEKRAA